jgi:hypothetical protein
MEMIEIKEIMVAWMEYRPPRFEGISSYGTDGEEG